MNKNEEIIKFLDSKKAENIELIDLRNSEYFVESVIIATTNSSKQAIAIIDELKILINSLGEKVLFEEKADEWSVLDLGDCLVHLMSPLYRDKYQIEKFLISLKR
ncbi:ribosome silencing factor [Campylobacter sp. MG1]|uniref:ribosome silencing factor n=1 Tax=Campylobacter sp. MG1 TaxID=2976332 RepID=UPI00226C7454|nr:ribosome silencing factor [Campylobacter sp. MG1]